MTSDDTTIEKQTEKQLFERLQANQTVQKYVKRLEVLVLRENEEDTKVLIIGQMNKGMIVDTTRTEIDLSDGWQKKDMDAITLSLAKMFLDELEMAIKFSSDEE